MTNWVKKIQEEQSKAPNCEDNSGKNLKVWWNGQIVIGFTINLTATFTPKCVCMCVFLIEAVDFFSHWQDTFIIWN